MSSCSSVGPSVAKVLLIRLALLGRLKSCSFTKPSEASFSAACKAQSNALALFRGLNPRLPPSFVFP